MDDALIFFPDIYHEKIPTPCKSCPLKTNIKLFGVIKRFAFPAKNPIKMVIFHGTVGPTFELTLALLKQTTRPIVH